MADLKIYYFPIYGRAEATVQLLAHSKCNYEKVPIETKDWPAKKAEWGGCGLPQLEFKDGTRMGEASSMIRFLGSMHGYYPADPLAAYKNDMLVDTFSPLYDLLGQIPFCEDADKKAELCKKFMELVMKTLDFLEPMITPGKWLTGDKLGTADFTFGNFYTNMCANPNAVICKGELEACMTKYPKFCEFGKCFAKENAAYLESRPPCPF